MNRRTLDRALIIIVVFVLLGVAGFAFLYWSTDRARKKSLAATGPPAAWNMHVALERYQMSGDHDALEAEWPESIDLETALDNLNRWSVLLAQPVEDLNADPNFRAAFGGDWESHTDPNLLAFFRAAAEEQKETIKQLLAMPSQPGPVDILELSMAGPDTELRHLSKLRTLARLMVADTIAKAADGRPDEAVRSFLACMRVGDALRLDPVLVPQLVRSAIGAFGFDAARASLSGESLSDERFYEVLEYLQKAYGRGGFADALIGEARIAHTVFESSVFFLDEWAYLDAMVELSRLARKPFHESARERQSLEASVTSGWASLTPMTRMQIPAMLRSHVAQARRETMIDLLLLGLVVERYKAETGAYPATLEDAVARYNVEVPVDPFTGEPYRYEPRKADYVLYGVGDNKKDDGGVHDYRSGDIVWSPRETVFEIEAAGSEP